MYSDKPASSQIESWQLFIYLFNTYLLKHLVHAKNDVKPWNLTLPHRDYISYLVGQSPSPIFKNRIHRIEYFAIGKAAIPITNQIP